VKVDLKLKVRMDILFDKSIVLFSLSVIIIFSQYNIAVPVIIIFSQYNIAVRVLQYRYVFVHDKNKAII